jgi:hypothetical protein
MKKIIIGSHAIKQFYPDFREPKDLDYICENDDTMTPEVQCYWIPEFEELLKVNRGFDCLDPDCMLTLKAAHANWNIHWEKTINDILFLQSKGHEINVPLYKLLVKGWRKIHGKESAPLRGKDSKTFFEDAVHRHYNHDSIHEAVAYYDRPLFERTLTDPESGSVMCSEEKFNEMSLEDRVKMAKEEIFVTALERYIIPAQVNGKPPYSKGRAYMQSLKKFVTTMSSGWMSLFLIENYSDLVFDKSDDYVTLLESNKDKLIKL